MKRVRPVRLCLDVMELVEGRTLDDVIKDAGPLPLTRIVEIAVQVAEGLAEAHAKSIVHRDLKPKNIMITSAGRVKILDFGMAKPLVPARPDDDVMKTTEASSLELTREGMVFGTVAYMSPEQASGRPVDSRSDVFAFGVMLYEMATGKRPFDGESLTSTLAKILETEPPALTDSRSDIAPEFSRIIHRCLRKNPRDRYNDTRDLAVALKDFLHETSSGAVRGVSGPAAAVARPRGRRRPLLYVAAGATVLLAAVALTVLGPRLLSRPFRFVPPSFEQVAFNGVASFPTLSPDGRSLAYLTSRPGGPSQVVIQDVVGKQQLPILEAEWVRSLRWSPGGTELLVSGGARGDPGRTHLVSRLGGASRPLRYFPFVAWSPDGSRFAGATLSGKKIWFTETTTGTVSSIDLGGSFSFLYEIDWSPQGGLLAFRTSDEGGAHAIRTVTVDGSEQHVVAEGSVALQSSRFSPRGDAIYYLSGREATRRLHKVRVDPRSGEARGPSMLLLSGLQVEGQMALSPDGKRLLYARATSHANV